MNQIKKIIASSINKKLEGLVQVGSFVEFYGIHTKIKCFICRVNNDTNTVDYVRENLQRWNVSMNLIQKGSLISEDNFISEVKYN